MLGYKLNSVVAKMQTIHSTSAAASTGLSENSFELDGSDELALPSPVPELVSATPHKSHSILLTHAAGSPRGRPVRTPKTPSATVEAASSLG